MSCGRRTSTRSSSRKWNWPKDRGIQGAGDIPQMLDPELVGRSPVERTELRYRTDVCLLGARRQIAHRHVVDHALAQRRDRLGHRWAPVGWAARTRNPRRQDASYDDPTPIGTANG